MQFSSFSFCPQILQTLASEGYETPTPIQAKAMPPALEGRDVLGCAQTGTGKTAAFALPILNRLHAATNGKTPKGPRAPKVLVLAPTRELATQIAESFATYGKGLGFNGTIVYGGVNQTPQVRALQRGIDILVATPGRLMDLMQQGHVNLSQINTLVLDEADRMLDMGFIQPIRKIVSHLTNKERQTLLFSATMPKEIMSLADSLLRNPVKVAVTPVASAAPLIEQMVYMAPRQRKQALLEHLMGGEEITRAVVFTRTKHGADKVCRGLIRAGVETAVIHGNKAQNYRQRALDSFRAGKVRVLVATDVAARGLDVDAISHVFNYDLPVEPEAYVHRIGRTGRAGATGIAISFCDGEERGLLRSIERLTGKQIMTINKLPELPVRSPELVREDQAERPERPDTRARSSRGGRPGAGAGRRPERSEVGTHADHGHARKAHAAPHPAPAPVRGARGWSSPKRGMGGGRSSGR
jgi:ATP-dependent RNA helicase RhlE